MKTSSRAICVLILGLPRRNLRSTRIRSDAEMGRADARPTLIAAAVRSCSPCRLKHLRLVGDRRRSIRVPLDQQYGHPSVVSRKMLSWSNFLFGRWVFRRLVTIGNFIGGGWRVRRCRDFAFETWRHAMI